MSCCYNHLDIMSADNDIADILKALMSGRPWFNSDESQKPGIKHDGVAVLRSDVL